MQRRVARHLLLTAVIDARSASAGADPRMNSVSVRLDGTEHVPRGHAVVAFCPRTWATRALH